MDNTLGENKMSWYNPASWGKGSEQIAENILDKDDGLLTQVGGWIGNMNYTDEEKAKFTERLNNGVASFVEMTLAENTVRSKARREVALLWIKAQLAMIFIVMMVAPLNFVLAKFYLTIAFGTLMVSGTLAVLGFFFGSHMLSSHLNLNKGKK